MSPGIRADIEIGNPETCQVAPNTEGGGEGTAVSKTVPESGGKEVVEEFTLDGGDDPDGMNEVFRYGSKRIYRFTRERDQQCACEIVEQIGCPIRTVRATEGRLAITFLAPDIDTLRSVIADLKDAASDVHVRRLTRAECPDDSHSLLFVDTDEFTPRQVEVMATAHRMGYFKHPKEANAGEVASALDIATPTFTEHLAAAQSKIMAALLD